ncbi:hypothetical protein HK102_000377 [Quaeritorhiza haematococci]|nr:hypothetical protein HK102_000377 [Quaeritorhiza haematococci]
MARVTLSLTLSKQLGMMWKPARPHLHLRPTAPSQRICQLGLKAAVAVIALQIQGAHSFSTQPAHNAAHQQQQQQEPQPATSGSPIQRALGFFRKSRDMMKQYWKGSKLLLQEGKEGAELKRRVKQENYALTRREFVLVSKHENDLRNLVPFFLVLVFIPELLPFLLVYAPNIVPSTCWSQEQIDARRTKLDELRKKMARDALTAAQGGAVGGGYLQNLKVGG